MRLTLFTLSMFLVFLACARKLKSESPGHMPSQLSQDALPAVTRIATRPDGGGVVGKGPTLDPEVAERRKMANTLQPIVFGESAGGITMQTTAAEARSILAPAFGASQGVEFYPEHIRIAWKGDDTSTPAFLVVDEGYAGKLQLTAPYGALSVGQSLAPLITNLNDMKTFLLNAGTVFEKQAAGYDCEKALSCRLLEDSSFYSLQFRRGGILIGKTPELPLSFVFFDGPNKFYARPTDAIVYGISVAGINFQSKRAAVEARIGPPEEPFGGNILYYDQRSIGILWGADSTPTILQALGSYQGSLNFGTTLGVRKINDSFATYAPTEDDGTVLMQNIYRGITNTAVDCKTLAVPCVLTIDAVNKRITMEMDRSAFVFTSTADKTWLLYGSIEP